MLCSASAYLCGVLSQTCMGKSGGRILTVQFKADIPASSLSAFIDYIYQGRIKLAIKSARDLNVMARCLHVGFTACLFNVMIIIDYFMKPYLIIIRARSDYKDIMIRSFYYFVIVFACHGTLSECGFQCLLVWYHDNNYRLFMTPLSHKTPEHLQRHDMLILSDTHTYTHTYTSWHTVCMWV